MKALAQKEFEKVQINFAAHLGRALKWFGRVIRIAVNFYQNRQVMESLYGLNDHELRDIGLFRSDLNMEAGERDDRDPTKRLARVVKERHMYR